MYNRGIPLAKHHVLLLLYQITLIFLRASYDNSATVDAHYLVRAAPLNTGGDNMKLQ